MKLLTELVRRATAWAWQHEVMVCDGVALLKKLHMDENGIEMHIQNHPEMAQWIAQCFASMVASSPNYTEMKFDLVAKPKDENKWQWITVLIQKGNGKTPHELREKAEQELAAIKNTETGVPELMAVMDELIGYLKRAGYSEDNPAIRKARSVIYDSTQQASPSSDQKAGS